MKNRIFLCICVVCFFVLVNAQTSVNDSVFKQFSEGRFGIFGGVSLPTGDFSDEEKGAARTGFLVGGDFTLPFRTLEKLGWFSTFSVICNSVEEPLADVSLSLSTGSLKTEAGRWMLITPLTGLKFTHQISQGLGLYGIAQAGWMIGRSPNITIKTEYHIYNPYDPWEDEEISITQESAFGYSFAFSLGAGIVINDNINLSLRYLSGKPKYDIKIDSEGWFDIAVNTTTKQQTSLFQLVVGYDF